MYEMFCAGLVELYQVLLLLKQESYSLKDSYGLHELVRRLEYALTQPVYFGLGREELFKLLSRAIRGAYTDHDGRVDWYYVRGYEEDFTTGFRTSGGTEVGFYLHWEGGFTVTVTPPESRSGNNTLARNLLSRGFIGPEPEPPRTPTTWEETWEEAEARLIKQALRGEVRVKQDRELRRDAHRHPVTKKMKRELKELRKQFLLQEGETC